MITRCKFVCNLKDEKTGYSCFSPVYSGSEENKQFFKYTPGGELRFFTVNASVYNNFEMGKEYYIDISEAL